MGRCEDVGWVSAVRTAKFRNVTFVVLMCSVSVETLMTVCSVSVDTHEGVQRE